MKIIIINKIYQFLSNDTKLQNKVSYFDNVDNYNHFTQKPTNFIPPLDIKPNTPQPNND